MRKYLGEHAHNADLYNKFKWKDDLLTPREWEIIKDVALDGQNFNEIAEKYELSSNRVREIYWGATESLEKENEKIKWYKSDNYKMLRHCTLDLEEYLREISKDLDKVVTTLQEVTQATDLFCRLSVKVRQDVEEYTCKYEGKPLFEDMKMEQVDASV